jgi:membrane associated rhomboid family serine protease
MEFRPSKFSILPPVVKNLLILNGLFFLATIVFETRLGIDLVDILGLHYFAADEFKPYQLITYMFMHGSFTHILFNMLAVWMFGNALENVWGSKRFLTYYLITGIGAALIQYLVLAIQLGPAIDAINFVALNPTHENVSAFFNSTYFGIDGSDYEMQNKYHAFIDTYNTLLNENNMNGAAQAAHDFFVDYKGYFLNLPKVVGASGALFGLLLAFGMIFPNALIFLYFAIPIKAKYFVILYGLIELFYGFANTEGDNVAHFAHLGGMLFGFIMIKMWKRKGVY